jgi:uncharacterized membrane protein HdeD (DUF308 family)
MKPTPSDAVLNWTAGFAAAALIQGLFPGVFAGGTSWGRNDGWQREIAIWNVGQLTTVFAVRRPGAEVDRALASGFSVLSALFGLNHLAAAMRSPRSWGNWLGAGANAVGLGVGLAALASPSDGRRCRLRAKGE